MVLSLQCLGFFFLYTYCSLSLHFSYSTFKTSVLREFPGPRPIPFLGILPQMIKKVRLRSNHLRKKPVVGTVPIDSNRIIWTELYWPQYKWLNSTEFIESKLSELTKIKLIKQKQIDQNITVWKGLNFPLYDYLNNTEFSTRELTEQFWIEHTQIVWTILNWTQAN